MMAAVIDRVRDTSIHGVARDNFVAVIALHSCTYAPAFVSTEVPCVTLFVLFVDDDSTPQGGKRSCIVVEGPIHALLG